MAMTSSHGDLNNTAAVRPPAFIAPDPILARRALAIPASEDDPNVRGAYRPFLLPDGIVKDDWIAKLELSTAIKMVEEDWKRNGGDRIKVLVLFGSLRRRYGLKIP